MIKTEIAIENEILKYTDMELKQIPHSLEAEQGVIASIIIDYEKIIQIREILQPHHWPDSHGR